MKGYTSEVTKVYTAKIWAVLYLSGRSLSALKEDSISGGDRNHLKGNFEKLVQFMIMFALCFTIGKAHV